MKKTIEPPAFATVDEEANWWASRQGREFLKRKSAEPQKKAAKGSRLVGQLSRAASYQTLLKMLVHEGLRREAGRA